MRYDMCRLENRYSDLFLSDEEMAILETIVKFVDKEIFPKRLDLEGGWHRDENLAEDTLDDLYAKLTAIGYQKAGVPVACGGLGISTALRLALNEELSREDVGFAFHAAKPHAVLGPFLATRNTPMVEHYA
jgi:alkylation response protein AidB-like acyl-CoA dehydrogenase